MLFTKSFSIYLAGSAAEYLCTNTDYEQSLFVFNFDKDFSSLAMAMELGVFWGKIFRTILGRLFQSQI